MSFRIKRVIIWGFILSLATLAALLLLPSFQTRLFRAYLRQHPEWGLEVEHARLGFGSLALSGVSYARPGIVFKAQEVEGKMPLLAALGTQLSFDRLVVRGVTAEIEEGKGGIPSAKQANVTTEGPRFLEQLKHRMHFPVPVRIGEVEVEGQGTLKNGEGQKTRFSFTLSGGDFAPSRTGNITLNVIAKDFPATSLVSSVVARSEFRMHMIDSQSFDHVTLVSDIEASGKRFPGGTHLKTQVNLGFVEIAPTCEIFVSTETQGEVRPLIHVRTETDLASKSVRGTWKVDLNPSDLKPYTLGIELPNFNAMGAGEMTIGPVSKIRGELDWVTDNFGDVFPAWKSVGSLKSNLKFSIVQEGPKLEVESLRLRLASEKPALALELTRPLRLSVSSAGYQVSQLDGDWLRADLQEFPLAWLNSSAGPFHFDEASTLKGQLTLGIKKGVIQLRSNAPLRAHLPRVLLSSREIVREADASASFSGDWMGSGWQVEFAPVDVFHARQRFGTLTLRAGASRSGADTAVKLQGVLQTEIDGLKSVIPGLLPRLQGGNGTLRFDASLDPGLMQIGADLHLEKLNDVAGQALAGLQATLRADIQNLDTIDFDASFGLGSEAHASDITFAGTSKLLDGRRRIEASLKGEAWQTADLARWMTNAFPLVSQDSVALESGKSGRLWPECEGIFRLAVKRLVFPGRGDLGNLALEMTVSPEEIKVDQFRAVIGEGSEIKGKGEVSYSGTQTSPYHYGAVLQAKDMDLGPLLTLARPDRTPVADGRFDVLLIGKGEAATPEQFLDGLTADIVFTSRGGRFHGFDSSIQKIDVAKITQPASRLGSIVDFAASMIGRTDRRGNAAEAALRRLVSMPYDQLTFELRNRPGRASEIREFSMISPEMRLLGTGSISFTNTFAFAERPMQLDLELRCRGKQAEDFGKLGLLQETPDSLGYIPLTTPLKARGSLYEFATETFAEVITQALAK